MEFRKVTLTFESVDRILWCDHSNESSLPVLSHDAICFSQFWKMKFGNLVETCLWPHLAVKGLTYGLYFFVLIAISLLRIKFKRFRKRWSYKTKGSRLSGRTSPFQVSCIHSSHQTFTDLFVSPTVCPHIERLVWGRSSNAFFLNGRILALTNRGMAEKRMSDVIEGTISHKCQHNFIPAEMWCWAISVYCEKYSLDI